MLTPDSLPPLTTTLPYLMRSTSTLISSKTASFTMIRSDLTSTYVRLKLRTSPT